MIDLELALESERGSRLGVIDLDLVLDLAAVPGIVAARYVRRVGQRILCLWSIPM